VIEAGWNMIDEIAKGIAVRRWGLPECLHVPVAAVDEDAIHTYVGEVLQVFGGRSPPKALLVKVKDPPPRDERLPIWSIARSKIFYKEMQVWVDVSYTRYRPAYREGLSLV
jgi:hypothetical protein